MKWRTNTKQLPVILKAALAYFALVFGAGFYIGTNEDLVHRSAFRCACC